MKARVKKTGEIVDVIEQDMLEGILRDMNTCDFYAYDDLDFNVGEENISEIFCLVDGMAERIYECAMGDIVRSKCGNIEQEAVTVKKNAYRAARFFYGL